MEGEGNGARLIPEDHSDLQTETVIILLGESTLGGSPINPGTQIRGQMHGDGRPRGGLFDSPWFALFRWLLLHGGEFPPIDQKLPNQCVDMSGNIYQKYEMQRIGKQPKDSESARERLASPMRMGVSELLARKVRHVSATTRLPEQVIAREAITRAFALLNS